MKEKKTIYCQKCVGEITDKDDLVVTNNFLSIVVMGHLSLQHSGQEKLQQEY